MYHGTPRTEFRGISDASKRRVPVIQTPVPTHCAKIYTYAKKGRSVPFLVDKTQRAILFGQETFDVSSKYANHATVLSNILTVEGNKYIQQRVIPLDAGPIANVRLWVDFIEAQLPVLSRNSDGSLGDPVSPAASVTGYKVKFVTTFNSDAVLSQDSDKRLGYGVEKDGSLTEGQTQSKRLPILDMELSSKGSWGNDVGFKLWAPTVKSNQQANTKLISLINQYLYRMSVVQRDSVTKTTSVVQTNDQTPFVEFVFKKNEVNPNTKADISLDAIFADNYRNLNNANFALDDGFVDKMYVYEANIERLLKLFHSAEFAFGDDEIGFSNAVDEHRLFNFIGGVNEYNVPYMTYKLVTDNDSVSLGENSVVFFKGGSDGTMSDSLFADLVVEELKKYADPNSSVCSNRVINCESIFYDSGFPVDKKQYLTNILSVRKDIGLVMATSEAGDSNTSLSSDIAVGTNLCSLIQLFPESEWFGTTAVRAWIISGNALMPSTGYKKNLPYTLDVARKFAKMQGASNRVWKQEYGFDAEPNNLLLDIKKPNYSEVPPRVAEAAWLSGINFVEHYTRDTLYYPAIRSVYSDETSVLLNSYVVLGCIELQKMGDAIRRKFSGRSSLTRDQFIEAVNKEALDMVGNTFAGFIRVIPEAEITGIDELLGYKWKLKWRVGGNNMKTVMDLETYVYRMDDLVASDTNN